MANAPVEGTPVFEWNEYHNENGGTQHVAEVPEGVRDVSTYHGERLQVKPGDLIAQTERPNEYTKVSNLDGWSQGGVEAYAPAEDAPEVAAYDPEDHTVADVKRYLDDQRDNGNEDEFNRVVSAETEARNRTGIVTQSW